MGLPKKGYDPFLVQRDHQKGVVPLFRNSSNQQSATSMERRDFIKLTAITGTSATLASCGNPEHQLIRFVPDEDLVPGVAEWKPSVCPLCEAGCGLSVRVMEADVEPTRNGQAGLGKMGGGEKLRGLA